MQLAKIMLSSIDNTKIVRPKSNQLKLEYSALVLSNIM